MSAPACDHQRVLAGTGRWLAKNFLGSGPAPASARPAAPTGGHGRPSLGRSPVRPAAAFSGHGRPSRVSLATLRRNFCRRLRSSHTVAAWPPSAAAAGSQAVLAPPVEPLPFAVLRAQGTRSLICIAGVFTWCFLFAASSLRMPIALQNDCPHLVPFVCRLFSPQPFPPKPG